MPRRDLILFEAPNNHKNLAMKTSTGVLTSYRRDSTDVSGFMLSRKM